jgi:MoaA/NifB/PqqE/SkfB family radical SAM enzyme
MPWITVNLAQRKIHTSVTKTGKNPMNNFCVLPFNSISISSTGNLRQCCNGGEKPYDLFVQDLSVDAILNNRKSQALRSSFLKDKQDSACSRCWNMESIGNRSFRHVANEDADHGLKSIIPIKMEPTIAFEDLQYLDITLGNKCNLACRMCNPYSSSLLAKQFKEFKIYKGDEFIDFSRASKDKILDLIFQATNLNSIYMLGGEPLINDFHDEIVELLVKQDRAKNIKLHYSTNIQIDIEKYLPMWKQFRYIDLNISIDGSHETYEYIRWPGKWDKVFKNLKRACEFRKEANFYPVIATTIQNLNAANLYDLISECSILNETYVPFFFIPVTGGNYLELTPKRILESEIVKLATLPDPYGRVKELIQHYHEAYNKHGSITKGQVKEFFSMQEKFDSYRKQNLFATHPYFLELAEQFKIETW